MRKIGVLGAGTWGMALARMLCLSDNEVTVWSALESEIDEFSKTRVHPNLPDMVIPDEIIFTKNIKEACENKDIVLFAVPSVFIRSTANKAAPFIKDGQIIVDVAKGIEAETLMFMSEVIFDEINKDGKHENVKIVALSGPTHAEEIVRNTPAGIVAASADEEAARIVQDTFMSGQLRVYTQKDVTGVEIAGAVKNVIAIATGISDGMKLGNNARAALMTRSIHEIKRLGDAMGAQPETFAGLSGIGDLIVTCSTNLSRNRRCGLLIGLGLSAKDAVERVGSVVEGYYTADAVCDLAKKLDVDMPVCKATQAVLKGRILPEKAVSMLMSRDKKDELK